MWRNFYIRLDDNRNHHPQSSLSSSLRFNERMMMKKRKSSSSSSSSKRAKAYVQGHHRKKPVRMYVREKNERERERKNVYKHDGRRRWGGRTSVVKENSKRRVVHTYITMRKKGNTIVHSLFFIRSIRYPLVAVCTGRIMPFNVIT